MYNYIVYPTIQAVQNDDKTSIQNWLEYLKGNPAEEAVLTDEDDSGNTIAHILVLRCDTEVLTTLLSGFCECLLRL